MLTENACVRSEFLNNELCPAYCPQKVNLGASCVTYGVFSAATITSMGGPGVFARGHLGGDHVGKCISKTGGSSNDIPGGYRTELNAR